MVLLLIVVWAVVLIPVLWKRRNERQPSGSIESFHHQLHLLERAGPKIVPPAFRLETANSGTGLAPGQSGYPAVSSMPGRPNLVLLRPVSSDDHGDDDDRVVDPATGNHYRRAGVPSSDRYGDDPRALRRSMRATQGSLARARTRRRRQDVLLGLAGTVVVTALAGIVPKFHLLWVLTGVAAAALVAFLALVASAQRWAAEARPRRSPSRTPAYGGARYASANPYAQGDWPGDGYEPPWAGDPYADDGYGYDDVAVDDRYGVRPRVAAAGR
ncbi:MAG: hypothetical protein ACYCU7_15410 [Acidimicrobiales bacterium]